MVGRHTTAIDNDAKNDETKDGNNLDHAEDEFHYHNKLVDGPDEDAGHNTFTITLDPEKLDNNQRGEEDCNPNADIIMVPIINRYSSGRDFERECYEPANLEHC